MNLKALTEKRDTLHNQMTAILQNAETENTEEPDDSGDSWDDVFDEDKIYGYD